ncbi:MAG: SDR family oxidoreductase, partial [Lachnospiraceae bacterium]|nr:SDR family oxidoreductase [Lachnospiraceae bacterium]
TVFEERGLDVLVNNAGISYVGLLHEMKEEEWQAVMNADLNSVFYHSKFAIPLMLRKHSGRIINISSVWGNVGASCEVAYSATKGGINAFTKALAKEVAISGISVNAISPGFVDTPMNSHLSDEELNVLFEEIPMGRAGTPKEIAQSILKLSEMPAYVTGQIITVDGGWT